jgi:hypothetical protein
MRSEFFSNQGVVVGEMVSLHNKMATLQKQMVLLQKQMVSLQQQRNSRILDEQIMSNLITMFQHTIMRNMRV